MSMKNYLIIISLMFYTFLNAEKIPNIFNVTGDTVIHAKHTETVNGIMNFKIIKFIHGKKEDLKNKSDLHNDTIKVRLKKWDWLKHFKDNAECVIFLRP